MWDKWPAVIPTPVLQPSAEAASTLHYKELDTFSAQNRTETQRKGEGMTLLQQHIITGDHS